MSTPQQQPLSTSPDYVCHCGKAFKRPENLARHARNHNTVRPFRCADPTCSKAFTRSDLLRRHETLHEPRDDSAARVKPASDGTVTPAPADLPTSGTGGTGDANVDWPSSQIGVGFVGVAAGSSRRPEQVKRKVPDEVETTVEMAIGDDDREIKRRNVIGNDPIVPWDSQQSNAPFLNELYPEGRSYPLDDTGRQGLDLASGEFLIDFDDPLPWDNGMMWFMDETLSLYATDTQEASTADTRDTHGMPGDTYDEPIRSANGIAGDSSSQRLDAATPPIDTSDDDRWPTNWNATGKVPFGAGARIPAASIERDSMSHTWERFWITELQLDRVQQSFGLAMKAPGPDVSGFRLPESLEVVNHFISLYFEKFEPQMPILHLPTFRIIDATPLLLAAMISLGATFSTLPGAKTFSTELVEVIRKSINVLFELDSSNLRSDSLIHVSLLSCISGLLSGTKRTFELAEAARGTLVILCRRADLLNSASIMRQLQRCDHQDVEVRWQRWARAESRKRLGASIFLLDSMFPAMLDTPAYISQGQMTGSVLPCDDLYWTAPNASMWMNSLGVASIPPSPFFALALSSILTPARIPLGIRPQPIPSLNAFGGLMLVSALQHHIFGTGAVGRRGHPWRIRGSTKVASTVLGVMEVVLLYGRQRLALGTGGSNAISPGHLALAVNVRVLFTAAGKMGWDQARQCRPDLMAWAESDQACMAIDHALDLLDVLEYSASTDLSYSPGGAFVAILTLWAALKFGRPTAISEPSRVRQRDRLSDRGMVDRLAFHQDPLACGKGVLEYGIGFLESSRAWRFGTSLALVLAKQLEREDEGE